MRRLYQRTPGTVGVDQWASETGEAEIVAVVFNDPADEVAAFFAANGGSWPVLDEPSLPLEFQVSQIPETFLVAPSGLLSSMSAARCRLRI